MFIIIKENYSGDKMKITEVLRERTVIYSSDDESTDRDRIKLRKYNDNNWFIERDDDIDPVPDYLSEQYIIFMYKCLMKAKRLK